MNNPKTSAQYALEIILKGSTDSRQILDSSIKDWGGDIADIFSSGDEVYTYVIDCCSEEHIEQFIEKIGSIAGINVIESSDLTFKLHRGGKLKIESKSEITTSEELSRAYTPGVARVCNAIVADPKKVGEYTFKQNSVAVVSDGTAVLGLGDIGPHAAMPVMEGKAQLFQSFAGINAVPICLDTKDPKKIIEIVTALAPTFGGINLEDISAPRCFEIEKSLKEKLDIPVFHDDQHGTAVVLTAALINALRLTGRKAEDLKVVVCGVGAAGTSCSMMILDLGVKNVIGVDRTGILYRGRSNMNPQKAAYAMVTNPNNEMGDLKDAIKGADMFIGLSGPDLLTGEDIKVMNKDPFIFAMSNPTPEIMPEDAKSYAKIIGTGRSDYPNQINNVLCFPGIFRGALDSGASKITEGMKMAAAKAISRCVSDEQLSEDYIIPGVFDKSVVPAVAKAVADEAAREGMTE